MRRLTLAGLRRLIPSEKKTTLYDLSIKAKYAGTKQVDEVLEQVNKLMKAHGVEAIRGEWVSFYFQDIVLLYVNTGDTYSSTVMYDTERDRFFIGSYGDWVERYGRDVQ